VSQIDIEDEVSEGAMLPERRRLMVAARSEMIRFGLTTMLLSIPGIDDIIQCHSLEECLDQLERQSIYAIIVPSTEFAPHETTALSDSASRFDTKILLVLDTSAPDHLAVAAEMPVDGFLLLDELTLTSLEEALGRLSRNEMPLPSRLAKQLLSHVRRRSPDQHNRQVLLTPRERQTLAFLVQGLSNKQIARRLTISEHGAKRHVANVLAKLNSPNRTFAVTVALKEGLLEEN
jgi:two-component system, NarL family, nitrate/nitrite response regulator NarL